MYACVAIVLLHSSSRVTLSNGLHNFPMNHRHVFEIYKTLMKRKSKTHKRVIIISLRNERCHQFYRNNSKNVSIIARQILDIIHNCCTILAHHPFAWWNHRMKSETLWLCYSWRKFLGRIIVKAYKRMIVVREREKEMKWREEGGFLSTITLRSRLSIFLPRYIDLRTS